MSSATNPLSASSQYSAMRWVTRILSQRRFATCHVCHVVTLSRRASGQSCGCREAPLPVEHTPEATPQHRVHPSVHLCGKHAVSYSTVLTSDFQESMSSGSTAESLKPRWSSTLCPPSKPTTLCLGHSVGPTQMPQRRLCQVTLPYHLR